MILSPDQQAALSDISTLLTQTDKREHILTGGPGTGKSYLTSMIIELAEKSGYQIILCATTNPACKILSDFTDREAHTIHKILDLIVKTNYQTDETYLQHIIRNEGPMIDQVTWGNNAPILLVIDEDSYLDRELVEYVRALLVDDDRIIVLYVGDQDQLPPVDYEEPYIFTQEIPKSTLVVDHRFAPDSQMAIIANALKKNIRSKDYFLVPIEDGPDITVTQGSEILDIMTKLYSSIEYANDPFYVRSIAYKNTTVDKMNLFIREMFTKEHDYQKGERLIVTKALIRKNKSVVDNGSIVTVEHAERTIFEGIDCQLLKLSGDKKDFQAYYSLDYKKRARVKNKLVKAAQDKKGTWKAVYRFIESWIDLKDMHACTIHKSQGGSFKNVILHLEDLVECTDATLLARLLLVGVSRASEHVYVIGKVPPNLLEQC